MIYRTGDRLYLIDSSGGETMRASMQAVLGQVGPVESAILINTHAHLDHICNNDVITQVPAQTRYHLLLGAGMTETVLDGPRCFAEEFDRIDAYADPFTSYQANRATYRLAGWIRDSLGLLVGRRRVLTWLFRIQFRKFGPARISRATMQALDADPAQPLSIAGVPWRGWVLGPDDVWVLEARAHTGHDVLVYLPDHRMLCMGDVTFPLFPTWTDSSRDRILECLRGAAAMARSGQVALLADGHGDRCYRGQAEVTGLLETLLSDHLAFEHILTDILAGQDGLTAAQVYSAVRRRADQPVVARYLALESRTARRACRTSSSPPCCRWATSRADPAATGGSTAYGHPRTVGGSGRDRRHDVPTVITSPTRRVLYRSPKASWNAPRVQSVLSCPDNATGPDRADGRRR